ncbi:MAG: hypothetical protein JRI55_07080, partial [Deltaproteobacteria bacterium]|jgi:hypothetical protein|nr:hypothetical protein [Deltaproteobacteria bacterium]
VLHGRLEFAVAVRQALDGVQPDCVAVELPETLAAPVLRGVERLPLLSVAAYHDTDGCPVYLPVEPADPLVEALRFGLERGLPVHLVDQDVERYGRHRELMPDPYAVKRLGHQRYCDAYYEHLPHGPPADPADAGRERVMAFHLQQLLSRHRRVVFVCGLAHARRVEALVAGEPIAEPLRRVRRDGITLYHLSATSSREVMAEIPFLSAAFERARPAGAAALDDLDRLAEQIQLAQRARENHERNAGETVPASALDVMFRFARNYALVEGRLAPDLYQLLVGARGAVDDNFAYEVWDLATDWPWQTDSPNLPVIELSIEDLYEHARYIRFHRKLKTRRRTMLRLVKRRAQEEHPGEWKEGWKGDAICSHQPEDIVVESYGDFLKKKAKGILSAENARVEPFTASLLDGIDVRETLRNWHEGRLYVREHQLIKGDVGSVVVIFDEDRGEAERFPYCVTWQGEHAQESDMAFYATPLGEKMAGPGISRCEYGGFLLTYPPGRMFHVFEDPYFDRAESKPERLLLAGIDYCVERLVVYVAARPPRSQFRSIAERFGKKVVYIPIGDLSPLTLRKIRVFHVLDGHPVRLWANDYI